MQHLTGLNPEPLAAYEWIHKHTNVIRQPAEDKRYHHRQNDVDGLLLLLIAGTKQRHHSARVAESHHHQGQEEAKRVAQYQQDDEPALAALIANCSAQFFSVHALPLHHCGQGQQSRAQPRQAAQHLDQQVTGRQDTRGFDDGEMTVHADAGQQEDAAVQRGLLKAWQDFAESRAKDPTAVSVHGPEGKGEAEEEVGQCQVHDVDVRAASALFHAADNKHHDAVAHCAQDKHNHVGDCQAPGAESGDVDAARDGWCVLHSKKCCVEKIFNSIQSHLHNNKLVQSRTLRTGLIANAKMDVYQKQQIKSTFLETTVLAFLNIWQ